MSDTETDKEQPRDDIKLKLAGFTYLLGDACMYAAAHMRHALGTNVGKMIGSASWFAGGVGAAAFGNPSIEKQLEIHATKLENYFKQQGIAIPADAREQSKFLKEKTVWDHTEKFMYEHPSEILNLGYLFGALTTIGDGIKESRIGKTILPKTWNMEGVRGMNNSMWIGMLVMLGALGGLLIKEDPKAKEKAKDGNFIDKTVAYFREKPLRWSAGMYTLNNIFLGLTAVQDWKDRGIRYKGQKFQPYYFSTLQLAAYLFGNAMLFMSPRNQITDKGFSSESLAKLEDAAARVIAAQPAEVQQKLLADVSQYLTTQKGITLDASTLASHMTDRIAELTQDRSPETAASKKWSERVAQPASDIRRGM